VQFSWCLTLPVLHIHSLACPRPLDMLTHAAPAAHSRRLAHPDLDWLHLAGLIHGLGKLLAHQSFGCQPQWAVCGETFPVGCRFDDHIAFAQYFSVNPDRR
jgi:inositol oxygenase